MHHFLDSETSKVTVEHSKFRILSVLTSATCHQPEVSGKSDLAGNDIGFDCDSAEFHGLRCRFSVNPGELAFPFSHVLL